MRWTLLLSATLATLLLCTVAADARAQTVGYAIDTGDVWLDTRIGEVDTYGRRYRDPFITEVVGLGAPRSLVVELLDTRRWSPGDIYIACTIASVLGIGCARVVERHDRNPGRGWGRIAQDLGIRPGSPEFHALKRGTARTYERWGYPVEIGSQVRIDWSDGPRGRGRSAGGPPADHGPPAGRGPDAGSRGEPGRGQGQGNRGQGRDEGRGRGRGGQ